MLKCLWAKITLQGHIGLEHPLLDSCCSKSAKFHKQFQELKLEFTSQGVGFYSFKKLGVCRYLNNVDEVNCPRFFVFSEIIKNLT